MFPTKCAGFTSVSRLLSSPSAMFTKRGKVRCENLHPTAWGRAQLVAPTVGICDSKDDNGVPVPALCQQGFQELVLTIAALLAKHWLLFVQMCVKEKEQKIGLNKMQELGKRWEMYTVILVSLYSYAFSKYQGGLWKGRERKYAGLLKIMQHSVWHFLTEKNFECFKGLALGCVLRHCV